MKALSLWQPWASYIAAGAKRVETRDWSTRYRGPLAIHAARRRMTTEERELLLDWPLVRTITYGAVVATTELVDCVQMTRRMVDEMQDRNPREFDLGCWVPGRYAWILNEVVPLDYPVFTKGAQGLWEWRRP
jgi:hypothetical protein